jgi:hypothetical protein
VLCSGLNTEQRIYTVLLFLSDVPASDGGGHTYFPSLGIKVLPTAGDAVLWSNVPFAGKLN